MPRCLFFWWFWGIHGQVALSALGSSYACPTAFITFCPSWRLHRIQFHQRGPTCSLPEWLGLQPSGLYRFRRTSRSVFTPSLGTGISWLPLGPPELGWHLVFRLANPLDTWYWFRGQLHITYSIGRGLLAGRLVRAVGQSGGLLHCHQV